MVKHMKKTKKSSRSRLIDFPSYKQLKTERALKRRLHAISAEDIDGEFEIRKFTETPEIVNEESICRISYTEFMSCENSRLSHTSWMVHPAKSKLTAFNFVRAFSKCDSLKQDGFSSSILKVNFDYRAPKTRFGSIYEVTNVYIDSSFTTLFHHNK